MIAVPLGSLLVSSFMLTAAAGGPPRINIEATCRASEIELKKLFGNDTMVTIGGCVMQENAALEEMRKSWATFASADKASCIQPRNHMPSYVEWLTCLETQKEVRRIRSQERSSGATSKGTRN